MKTYTYIDNSKTPPEVVLVAVAESIVDADKAFKALRGQDASKLPFIGCQITECTNN